MAESRKWITPVFKQLVVVAGVSLNMASIGGVMGFTAILLPQLRASDSKISTDSTSESWIASIIGVSLLVGNIIVPTLMGKFGRKVASLISCSIVLVCWIWIVLATEVTSILIARFFQGLSCGINLSLSPIMIGEFTSPSNRGLFSAIMTSSITIQTLLVHVIGSYLTWQTTALVCAGLTAVGLAILVFAPESPSWLADRGKYEDSAKAYRWLRGDEDGEELEKMLETSKTKSVIVNNETYKQASVIMSIRDTSRRREFYLPVLIMVHLFTLSLWTGMVFLIVYTVDILRTVVGQDVDVALHVTVLDIQRMISTICGLIVVKKVRRRTIFFTTLGINLAALISLAAYTFAKYRFTIPFDHPAIGIILLHIHMFAITTGSLPLPLIISAELFPLEFRSLAGGISGIAFSLNYFLTSKTLVYLIDAIGIDGAYALYAAVSLYCIIVVGILLPETKDRTLQDIENEFKRGHEDRVRAADETVASSALNCEKNGLDEEEEI